MIKNIFKYVFSFLINAFFFFVICIYLIKTELSVEVYIVIVTIYGYMLSKLNSMITMTKNKLYLIYSYLSLVFFIVIGVYLKKYVFEIELIDFNTIFIIFYLIVSPIVHYSGIVNKYIDKNNYT